MLQNQTEVRHWSVNISSFCLTHFPIMDFNDALKIYSEEILNNCIALSCLAGSLQCKLFGALFPPHHRPLELARKQVAFSGVRAVQKVTFLCVGNWPITMSVITRTSWLVYIAFCDWWKSCIRRLFWATGNFIQGRRWRGCRLKTGKSPLLC